MNSLLELGIQKWLPLLSFFSNFVFQDVEIWRQLLILWMKWNNLKTFWKQKLLIFYFKDVPQIRYLSMLQSNGMYVCLSSITAGLIWLFFVNSVLVGGWLMANKSRIRELVSPKIQENWFRAIFSILNKW